MKRVLFITQFILFFAFNFFLFLSIVLLLERNTAFDRFNHNIPLYNGKEEFDSSLNRLSSISKLEVYCDSLFAAGALSDRTITFEKDYPTLVSSVIRRKFFHGYSNYGYSDNYMALLLEPLTGKDASAIVIPDDLMKYPYAACSQQSIVMMELLKRKGFITRKVGFYGGEEYGGHFSFEVYYKNSWHYFDPNQEPDAKVLAAYNRPSIAFLAKHEAVLMAAYNHWDSAKVRAVLLNYSYGKPNYFEAPNALLYQRVTKFLSYTLWFFLLLAFLFVRRKYLKLISRNSEVPGNSVVIPSIVKG